MLRYILGSCFFRLASLFSVIAHAGHAQSSADDLLLKLQSRYANIGSLKGIQIQATSLFKLDSHFMRLNPKFDASKYGAIVERYDVSIQDKLFKISANFTQADGKTTQTNWMTFDGENTACNYGGANLLWHKGLKVDPDNSLSLGSVVFLPFSFLLQGVELGKFPILTTADFKESSTWSSLEQRAVLDVEKNSSGEIVINVSQKNGSYYVVRLSLSRNLFPVSLELFSQDHKKLRSLEVKSMETTTLNGVLIPYAKEAIITFYISGMKISEQHVTIDRLDGLSNASEDDFAIDPTSAEWIFDEATKTQIHVPK